MFNATIFNTSSILKIIIFILQANSSTTNMM